MRWWTGVFAALLGCASADIGQTPFRCNPGGTTCPPGYRCVDGICTNEEGEGEGEGESESEAEAESEGEAEAESEGESEGEGGGGVCESECGACDECIGTADCDAAQIDCFELNGTCASLLCCIAGCPGASGCFASDCADPSCETVADYCNADAYCADYFCAIGDCLLAECGFPLCVNQESPPTSECADCVTCLDGGS